MKKNTLFLFIVISWFIPAYSIAQENAAESLGVPVTEGDNSAQGLSALNSSQRTIRVTDEQLKEKAFNTLINELYPASVSEIKEIKKREYEYEKAIYDEKPPQVLNDVLSLSLKPGSEPPTIFVAPGHSTTITLIDASGKPWPMTSSILGNSQDYQKEPIPDHAYKNVVSITPRRKFGTTNLTFTLVEQATPVTVNLINNVEKYHPTPIVRIEAYGPMAEMPSFETVRAIDDDLVMKNLAIGLCPQNSVMLVPDDKGVDRACLVDDWLYIRTEYKLVSPLPKSVFNSPDGTAAYKLLNIPVIHMSDKRGRKVTVTLKEKKTWEGKTND